MPRPLKRGILGASTIILSKDINKYAFMFGSNFYETDVSYVTYFGTIGNLIDLMNQTNYLVRYLIHVDTRWVSIQTDGM